MSGTKVTLPETDPTSAVNITFRAQGHTKYRRMPMLGDWSLGASSDKSRQIHCDRNGGHILVVQEGEIVCTACNAVWKDEGF